MFVRNAAATLTISVFIVPMSDELGWSRTLIVGASSVAGLAAIFVSPLFGLMVQRYSPRIVLVLSVIVLGAVIMSIRWVDSFILFYLLFGIGRITFAIPAQIAASTIVAHWFKRKRGKAMAVLGIMHSAGMGLFPLAASFLISAEGGGWRLAWFWMGIAVWIIALPPVWSLIVDYPAKLGLKMDNDKASSESTRVSAITNSEQWTLAEARKTPTLWLISVTTGILFLIHTGVNIHSAAFMYDRGIAPTTAAAALSVMAAGSLFGSIAWGWSADRFSIKITYIVAALWLGAASLIFLTIENPLSAFVAAAIFGVGLGALLVLPGVVAAHYFGHVSIGSIRGVTEIFVAGGQAIGGVAAGLVYDLSGGYEFTFPAFAAFSIVAVILILFTKTPSKIPTATANKD